jgi:hypothetical protein
VRGRAGRDEIPSRPRANMGNDSTECDNCQGNGTKFVSFELRRNKWNGWKGLAGIWEFRETKTEKSLGWLAKKLENVPSVPGSHGGTRMGRWELQSYSSKTNVSNDLLILILRLWYSMKPSFLNLFIKKFTRERVEPIISDKVSWEIVGSSSSSWCCTFP